jgi:hypothetical protein
MSLSYTTGNPSNLTAGATANMTDIQGPFTDIQTWANAKFSAADLTTATLQTLGMTSGSQIGRGKSIIATNQSTTSAVYTTLTTPDQVAGIVVPTDGVLFVLYHALWASSVGSAANAAVFIGANQLKVEFNNFAVPTLQEATSGTNAGVNATLGSSSVGIVSTQNTGVNQSDVTTGQVIGNHDFGGPIAIKVAAGTYTVSVQFKVSSGNVAVQNRNLWVYTLGF